MISSCDSALRGRERGEKRTGNVLAQLDELELEGTVELFQMLRARGLRGEEGASKANNEGNTCAQRGGSGDMRLHGEFKGHKPERRTRPPGRTLSWSWARRTCGLAHVRDAMVGSLGGRRL